MPAIEVLVVDPAAKKVFSKKITSHSRVVERVIGGKVEISYVWEFFPRHAVCTPQSGDGKGWALRSENGQISEVFHGPGLLYKVEASKRTSHSLRVEEVRDSIRWIENEKES